MRGEVKVGSWLASGALAALILCGVACRTAPTPPASPQPLRAVWTDVHFPDDPLVVTAHDGTLWVGGFRGMLARSDDGGRSWRVVRKPRGDGLIFAIAFRGREGVAAGSPGAMWVTEDNGATWREDQREAPSGGGTRAGIFLAPGHRDIAFASRGELQFFRDGVWSSAAFPPSGRTAPDVCGRDKARGPSQGAPALQFRGVAIIHGFAALGDGAHYAALLADGRLMASRDGGRTWTKLRFNHMDPEGLFAANGKYWAVGRGPFCSPRAAESADGVEWKPAATRYFLRQCGAQGCLAEGDVIVRPGLRPGAARPVSEGIPPITPPEGAFSWAAAQGGVCVARADALRCAAVAPGTLPPPRADRPPTGDTTPPSVVFSPDPDYSLLARQRRLQGTVVIEIVITRTGLPSQITLLSAPDASLARKALEAVAAWRFRPAQRDGRAVSGVADAFVSFRLF